MPKKAEKTFKNCNLAREGGTDIELDKHYQDQSIKSGTQKYSTVETKRATNAQPLRDSTIMQHWLQRQRET